MATKRTARDRADAARRCRSLYRLIRKRIGEQVSDREIARRWDMEWKSFAALKHGQRQVPRIDELERLAVVLQVPVADVFHAASGTRARSASAPAERADALGLTLDRVPDALFTIDVNGRIHDFNRALPLLTGRTEHELRERSVLDLIAMDCTSRALACIAGATREGQPSEAEVVLFTPSSTLRMVTLRATPVHDADGGVVGAQVIARDVTAERNLDGDLSEQRRLLQTVFDRIPAACILFEADGTIVAANPLVEGVCHASAAEIIGRRVSEVFGDGGSESCPVTRAARSKRVEQQVSWMTNRQGQAVYVHRTAGPVSDSPGGDRVIEVLVDVTDQLRRGDLRVMSLWRGNTSSRGRAAAERRESPRAETAFTVKYRYQRRMHEAPVENLGQGGLFIQTDERLSQGARLELEWLLPGDNARVRAVAVVAWNRAASGGAPAGIGVRFVAVAPDPARGASGDAA